MFSVPMNETATKLSVIEKNNDKEIELELDSNFTEFASLNDKQIPVNLTNSGFELLKEIVKQNNSALLDLANEYQTTGREFYSFLYDTVSLVWYLDKLPNKFRKLAENFTNVGDLMHNRLQAQIAYGYHISGHSVDLETPKSSGSKPDLNIDNVDTEIKTIISLGENDQKSFKDFARRLRTRHDEAIAQIEGDGMVFISLWSHVMNNIFKEYFTSRYSTSLPDIKKGNTVLVLEGINAFEDYFSIFQSNQICDEIDQFALSGYRFLNDFSHLGYFRRSGFPTGRSSSSTGVGITINIG